MLVLNLTVGLKIKSEKEDNVCLFNGLLVLFKCKVCINNIQKQCPDGKVAQVLEYKTET